MAAGAIFWNGTSIIDMNATTPWRTLFSFCPHLSVGAHYYACADKRRISLPGALEEQALAPASAGEIVSIEAKEWIVLFPLNQYYFQNVYNTPRIDFPSLIWDLDLPKSFIALNRTARSESNNLTNFLDFGIHPNFRLRLSPNTVSGSKYYSRF